MARIKLNYQICKKYMQCINADTSKQCKSNNIYLVSLIKANDAKINSIKDIKYCLEKQFNE